MSRGHGTSTRRSRASHRRNQRMVQAVKRAQRTLGTRNEHGYKRMTGPEEFVPKGMTVEGVLNAPV